MLIRTSFFSAVLAVCTLVLTPAGRICADDWGPGEAMAQSMLINLALGRAASEKGSLGFSDTCYLGAFLSPGNNSYMTMTLEGGRLYAFVGATDVDADLDILIERESGGIVAKDTKTDNVPIVTFTPPSTGLYTVRLKLYSADQARFCGMMLLQDGGWTVP
ncbi:MAG: hypothetical protein AAFP69_16220, partial [Planctomycetota bacterium]